MEKHWKGPCRKDSPVEGVAFFSFPDYGVLCKRHQRPPQESAMKKLVIIPLLLLLLSLLTSFASEVETSAEAQSGLKAGETVEAPVTRAP